MYAQRRFLLKEIQRKIRTLKFNTVHIPSLASDLCAVSSQHDPHISCKSLIHDDVVETGLCQDVATTVSVFPLS